MAWQGKLLLYQCGFDFDWCRLFNIEWYLGLTKHILKHFLTKLGHEFISYPILLISTALPSINLFLQAEKF
jgi:hypothetical protein